LTRAGTIAQHCLTLSFNSVTIVGAGPVACGIAVAIARVGVPVAIVRAVRGEERFANRRVDRRLRWHVDGGEMTPTESDRVRAHVEVTNDISHVGSADLVIETSFGEMRTRRALLATIESKMSPGAVLATNAPLDQLVSMAEVVRRRDQLVAMRFIHPATQSKVVELAVLPDTAPGVVAACRTFCEWLQKTAIVHGESPARVGYREFLVGNA
jgi:3-hydroxyacyl-CoA dehydrogenase